MGGEGAWAARREGGGGTVGGVEGTERGQESGREGAGVIMLLQRAAWANVRAR